MIAKTPGRSALAFIYIVVLLDLIGVNLLFPIQAYIVRQYNSDAITVGYLTVIYSAAQFFAAPILGMVSDRSGRRPVLLICLLGSAIGYFVFGLGMVLGPTISGTLGQVSLSLPLYVAGGLAMLNLAFGLFVLPESLPHQGRSIKDQNRPSANPSSAIYAVLQLPSLDWLLAAMFVYLFAFNGMISNIPVFLIEKFSISPSQMG